MQRGKRIKYTARKSTSPGTEMYVQLLAEHRDCPQKRETADLWHNGHLCDAEIVSSNGQQFKAHRLVLASSSDYMKALLAESRFSDSTNCPINLPGISSNTISLLLDWIYIGKCTVFTFSDAVELLNASCQLQIKALIDQLESRLCEETSSKKCIPLWELGERLSLGKLSSKMNEVALVRFDQLIEEDDFIDLQVEHLMLLVQSDNLIVNSEEQVYETVLKWAKANMEQESCDVEDAERLLARVRFPLISKEYVKTNVLTEALLVDNLSLFRAVSQSFADEDCSRPRSPSVIVTGANDLLANGKYVLSGMENDSAVFTKRVMNLCYCIFRDSDKYFRLSVILGPYTRTGPETTTKDLYSREVPNYSYHLPPESGWVSTREDLNPAPTIKFCGRK